MRVFAQQDFSPLARERDEAIGDMLDLTLTPGEVLHHPKEILKSDGTRYVVFTPYQRKWREHPLPTPADCLPAPKSLPPLPANLASEPLPFAEPVPGFPASGTAAQRRLENFLTGGLRHYQSQRDRMDLDGTSRLSPYLRFGLSSARECFVGAQVALLQAGSDPARLEIDTWVNELIWREFYTSILFHFPKVMRGAFREGYNRIAWRNDPDSLQAWQQSQTGYPVVDAAMRQLLATGWMHNRGRMIAASFLTKDLLINWQEGEAWFMAQLVDGDRPPTTAAGSGPRAPAPMPRPTSGCSTPSSRAKSSIPMRHTSPNGCRSWPPAAKIPPRTLEALPESMPGVWLPSRPNLSESDCGPCFRTRSRPGSLSGRAQLTHKEKQ